jgi:hypothetical protein
VVSRFRYQIDWQGQQSKRLSPTNTRRSILLESRPSAICGTEHSVDAEGTTISACNAAREGNRPAITHHINLQRLLIGPTINRFAGRCQPVQVSGRDRSHSRSGAVAFFHIYASSSSNTFFVNCTSWLFDQYKRRVAEAKYPRHSIKTMKPDLQTLQCRRPSISGSSHIPNHSYDPMIQFYFYK